VTRLHPDPVYLDNAASTPIDPRVRALVVEWLERPGNPSSRHAFGERAHTAIEAARGQVARALAAEPGLVTFTSGGTEANALAVLGTARAAARRGLGRHVVVGPLEHACVRESAAALAREGFEVETAPLAADGELDLARLERLLRPDTVLCALSQASNELGTLMPVARAAQLVRKRAQKARLHVDAVQAFGKQDGALAELGCDSLAISAHKVHGPLGAGALVRSSAFELEPLVFGGGHEQGLRSGTHNAAALAGLGLAAELAEQQRAETVRTCNALRAHMLALLAERIPAARAIEPAAGSVAVLPSILAVSLPGAPAEVRLRHLERLGVYASAGSACQARKHDVSASFLAAGLSVEEARHVLRFSFARTTTRAEVERAVEALVQVSAEIDGLVAR